jgi:hypothetical protein
MKDKPKKPRPSKKFPILEEIFFQTKQMKSHVSETGELIEGHPEEIEFTLEDITSAHQVLELKRPTSTSNFILDLTRKNKDISRRVPEKISRLGFDLKKRTGSSTGEPNSAGVFVFVGKGESLKSWLEWPATMQDFVLDSNLVPNEVKILIRNDEGALLSVIDYCDVLNQFIPSLIDDPGRIYRVQNPMKWHPNEIDGFYCSFKNGRLLVFPIEAKALSTKDDINLEQMVGGIDTVKSKLKDVISLIPKGEKLFDDPTQIQTVEIWPLAVQMIETGMRIAIFEPELNLTDKTSLRLKNCVSIKLEPPLASWVGKGYSVRRK